MTAAVLAMMVLSLLASSLAAAPLPLPASEAIPAAAPALEAALLDATNVTRAAHGLGALSADEGLGRAARAHAAEMARLHYFSHGSPVAAHATLQQRLALAGSPLVEVAENIVMLGRPGDPATAARQAVDDWLNSPPHRANLLSADYDRVGFGAASDSEGRLYVVQDFGSQPAQLLGFTLSHATRTVSEIVLEVRATTATRALFRVGSDAPVTQPVPAGRSTVVLTSDAEGSVQVVAGVARTASDYLEDDGGRLDLATGTYHADAGQPRVQLRIVGASVQQRVQSGARLTLRYASPPGRTLALFLQDSYQPQARVGPGSFALFLPDTMGVVTLDVGVNGAANAVSIVHRFHLDPGARDPRLQAGAPR